MTNTPPGNKSKRKGFNHSQKALDPVKDRNLLHKLAKFPEMNDFDEFTGTAYGQEI